MDLGVVVLYHYFNFNDKAKQNAKGCILALIKQSSTQGAAALASLERSWEKHRATGSQLSLEVSQYLLRLMMPLLDKTYIIVDALDECFERDELIELLITIHSWHCPHMHLLITSRKERDIEENLLRLGSITVSLLKERGNTNIDIYIDKQLDEDFKLNRWPQEAQNNIRTAERQKTNAM